MMILFTWVGWLRKDHPTYMSVVAMLNNVMGCVVAFIPEGVPVGVALTLMMVARRMKQRKPDLAEIADHVGLKKYVILPLTRSTTSTDSKISC